MIKPLAPGENQWNKPLIPVAKVTIPDVKVSETPEAPIPEVKGAEVVTEAPIPDVKVSETPEEVKVTQNPTVTEGETASTNPLSLSPLSPLSVK